MAKREVTRIPMTVEDKSEKDTCRYIISKNRRDTPKRFTFKKYSPLIQRREYFKEKK